MIGPIPVTLRFSEKTNTELARQIQQTLLDAYVKNKSEKLIGEYSFDGKDVP